MTKEHMLKYLTYLVLFIYVLCGIAQFLEASSAPVYNVVMPSYFVISVRNTKNQFDLIFLLSHYTDIFIRL